MEEKEIVRKGQTETEARRQRRRFLFEALFMCQFYGPEEIRAQLDHLIENEDLLETLEESALSPEEVEALKEKAVRVMERRQELDDRIDAVATGWKTARMGKPELSLIRQALYDILYDESIPYRVAINEAVELAKVYGGTDAPAFVNGVLGKLVRSMGLEEQEAAPQDKA